MNSDPYPSLIDDPNTNGNPKVTNRWFTLDLAGHFVTFSKILRASNYVPLLT